MTRNDETVLKPLEVDSIKGSFFVPSYQRGYRWGRLEVTQLLNDLQASQGHAYYLQPIAVRPRSDGSYELIDGQQRLTTLYLIKSYILGAVAPNEEHKFALEYETRADSAEYLRAPSEEKSKDNIDFLHIYQARNVIDKWFAGQSNPTIAAFELYRHLAQSVYVIWYEIPSHEDGIELFRRLNVGKIRLDSAELVKASLLTAAREAGQRVDDISRAWDTIERELRDPQFWAFACGSSDEIPTRISLILDAIADSYLPPDVPGIETAGIQFSTFERSLPHIVQDPGSYWDRVLDTHSALRSWFENRDLFHLIGYLTAKGASVEELVVMKTDSTQSAFRDQLIQAIQENVNLSADSLADLNYEDDRKKCEDLLLLFNVELSRSSSDPYTRYPFAAHSAQKWSVEHVNAQNAESLTTVEEWRTWLTSHSDELERRSVDTSDLRDQLRLEVAAATHSKNLSKNVYLSLRDRLTELLEEDTDGVHTIDNLALLSRSANSAIGNSVYSLKRRALIDMEKSGHFIPPGTRCVFQKYFTRAATPHLHLWDATDRADYLSAMQATLRPYLKKEVTR